jgi:hypothetical protein
VQNHFSNSTRTNELDTVSTKQLEQRVAKLETEFERMKADFQCATGQGWRAVVGSHEGSTTFESVVREMRRLRRKEYTEAAGKKAGS